MSQLTGQCPGCRLRTGLPGLHRRAQGVPLSAKLNSGICIPRWRSHHTPSKRQRHQASVQDPPLSPATLERSSLTHGQDVHVQRMGLQQQPAGRRRTHLKECLLMAILVLTFTHTLDAQAANLADAATAQLPDSLQNLSELEQGIVSGFLLIFFSELGDKTFFIALLLSLKQAKPIVFAGTFGALAIMTVISVALGELIHKADQVLPFNGLPVDDILATVLLIFFGIRTLQEANNAEEDAAEERGEAQQAVTQLEAGEVGALFASTFALVFAAEWGDKSFLATIALAASSSPVGVTLGAVAGHGVATGIAVLGGGLLSRNVSERLVQYLGGSLFLVFAAGSIYDIVTRGAAG